MAGEAACERADCMAPVGPAEAAGKMARSRLVGRIASSGGRAGSETPDGVFPALKAPGRAFWEITLAVDSPPLKKIELEKIQIERSLLIA